MHRPIELGISAHGSTDDDPAVGSVSFMDFVVIGKGHTQNGPSKSREPTRLVCVSIISISSAISYKVMLTASLSVFTSNNFRSFLITDSSISIVFFTYLTIIISSL